MCIQFVLDGITQRQVWFNKTGSLKLDLIGICFPCVAVSLLVSAILFVDRHYTGCILVYETCKNCKHTSYPSPQRHFFFFNISNRKMLNYREFKL